MPNWNLILQFLLYSVKPNLLQLQTLTKISWERKSHLERRCLQASQLLPCLLMTTACLPACLPACLLCRGKNCHVQVSKLLVVSGCVYQVDLLNSTQFTTRGMLLLLPVELSSFLCRRAALCSVVFEGALLEVPAVWYTKTCAFPCRTGIIRCPHKEEKSCVSVQPSLQPLGLRWRNGWRMPPLCSLYPPPGKRPWLWQLPTSIPKPKKTWPQSVSRKKLQEIHSIEKPITENSPWRNIISDLS